MVLQARAQPGRGGAIINMSSVNAVMAIPSIAGYNASKGGVNNLTRCVSAGAFPVSEVKRSAALTSPRSVGPGRHGVPVSAWLM